MQQLQWLSGCMKDKRKWFWLAMALAVVSAGLCVVFPFITQQITDRVLVGQTLPDGPCSARHSCSSRWCAL